MGMNRIQVYGLLKDVARHRGDKPFYTGRIVFKNPVESLSFPRMGYLSFFAPWKMKDVMERVIESEEDVYAVVNGALAKKITYNNGRKNYYYVVIARNLFLVERNKGGSYDDSPPQDVSNLGNHGSPEEGLEEVVE